MAEQVRAFKVGADDYLIKPVDPVELRSRIELHFRLRDNQRTTASLQGQIDRHHGELKSIAAAQTEQLLAIQDVTVFTLAKVAESRDNETGDDDGVTGLLDLALLQFHLGITGGAGTI